MYWMIGPCLLFLVWWGAALAGIADAFLFPSPVVVGERLGTLFASGELFFDLRATLDRVDVSFVISALVGVPLGLLLGRFEKAYRSLEFVIDFFRSTPATALFPLFLLFFGVGDSSKVAVAAFAAGILILFHTAYGVLQSRKTRLLAARLMGATKWQIFRSILFWESLPQTFVGLRSGVSLTLVLIVVTEMFIGATAGLGRKIIDFQITYDIPAMYAVILLTGTIGYLINLACVFFEKHWLQWNGK